MKSIVCVNCELPTIEDELSYDSGGSLRDYDIVLFDPTFPWYDRINFSAGGSCVSIEDGAKLLKSVSHWSRELVDALSAGKTVFVVLGPEKTDSLATSASTGTRNSTNYTTSTISNYSVLPGNISVRNARGRKVVVRDSNFRGLYESIKEILEYKVILDSDSVAKSCFSAKDGASVGGVIKYQSWPGSLVLLPDFDFQADGFTAEADDGDVWTEKAFRASHAFVGQLLAVDRTLRGGADRSPPPEWIAQQNHPKIVKDIESSISALDRRIEELRQDRDDLGAKMQEIIDYSHLLYETGSLLESAIENTLRMIGYRVDTLRIGDLEIDHVIVGPSGIRMIGESEGKDSSAIDISKFRQLESNIGEDFERDDVDVPAKGILFGNGYRFTPPEDRAEQFTAKSLTNARRLGSALIRTTDLYDVAVHLLDNPCDDDFKAACRVAIEGTVGEVVAFPRP